MPLKNGRLTPKERVFVDRFAATGDQEYAAEKAGFAHPRQAGSALVAKEPIMQEVQVKVDASVGRIVTKLLERYEKAAHDPKTSINDLTKIGRIMFPDYRASQQNAEKKELHEMTAEELQTEFNRMKAERLERARVVIEHEPSEAHNVRQSSAFE